MEVTAKMTCLPYIINIIVFFNNFSSEMTPTTMTKCCLPPFIIFSSKQIIRDKQHVRG